MTLPITFRGKSYASIRAAAIANDINVTTLWRAVLRGQADMVGRLRKTSLPVPVTINGVSYPSCSAAAKSLGYHPSTIVTYAKRAKGAPLRIPVKSHG